MRQKIRRIASVTLGFTIAIAPLPQVSLGHLNGITAMAEQTKASDRLQNSISAIINKNDNNHDYMKDSKYIELANKLGTSLLTKYSKDDSRKIGKHFNIGNLDGDNIPEIIVYEQRDFSKMDDEGTLVLYKYKDGEYKEIDRVSMNYDNGVENIIIGEGKTGKNAIFINSNVGAHSGQFYLFTLENDKLVNRISSKKANLLSVYPDGEIKDIDKDGILEFSIQEIDPESADSSSVNSEKINIWYKWDGKDGVNFVKYEKVGEPKEEKTDKKIVSNYNEFINKGNLSKAFDYLNENKDKLSIRDNSEGVRTYLSALNEELSLMNTTFNKYQEKYKMFENQGIMKKYKLKATDLNDINIIKNTSTFSKEKDLKKLLLNANSMGLKVATAEGSYCFIIDYEKLLNFSDSVSSEINDYLKIFTAESNKPGLSEEYVQIPLDEMASRIAAMEEFMLMYPYSKYLPEVNQMHEWYLRGYIFSIHDLTTHKVNSDTLKSYKKAMENYEHLVLHDILKTYTEEIAKNGNKITEDLIDKMNQIINEDEIIEFKSNTIDFSIIKYKSSETQRNEKLEKAIIDYLKYDKNQDGKVAYSYNYIDINGDGKKEIFVYLLGQSVSGSGGSTALIIEEKGYEIISKFTLARNPIIISEDKTNGWNDIIMQVAGGGTEFSYARMKFDGKKYPSNPSMAPRVKENVVKGTAIISNILSMKDGIEIK